MGHRLLIVEDHEATRAALRKILRRRGYEVAEAGNVTEGLALLDPPPRCVVLDLMLPDGPGEAVLRKVRSDNLPTRVAVCTGVHDPARLEGVRKLGPDALLQKPIDIEAICKFFEASSEH